MFPVYPALLCFFEKSVLDKVGDFDENFFIYFEDTDISRRVAEISRTVFS